MYSEIKEIFFNAAVQRQISVTVSNTILIAFRLAFKNLIMKNFLMLLSLQNFYWKELSIQIAIECQKRGI